MSAANIEELVQAANQAGVFINLNFGQVDGFENPNFVELVLTTKAEVGPDVKTTERKPRLVTRQSGSSESITSIGWKCKVDLLEYKLSQTTPGALAFHFLKDASRKRPKPDLVDILHVEELDGQYSYATRAVCIIKAGARNENEDEDVQTSYEFSPSINAFLNPEYNGKVYIVDSEVQGFVPDTSSTTASWAVPL